MYQSKYKIFENLANKPPNQSLIILWQWFTAALQFRDCFSVFGSCVYFFEMQPIWMLVVWIIIGKRAKLLTPIRLYCFHCSHKLWMFWLNSIEYFKNDNFAKKNSVEFNLFHWILLKIQTLNNVLTSMDLLTYLKFWHFVLAFQKLIQAKAIVLSCFEKLRLGFILIDIIMYI